MNVEMKALETAYRGYNFRSRLEARWALFLDKMGVAYEYEKEGYELGEAGWYLPDFWLPELHCWFEIKGSTPTPKAEEKCKALVLATQKNVHLSWTPIPWSEDVRENGIKPMYSYYLNLFMGSIFVDRGVGVWCVCPKCRKSFIAPNGYGSQAPLYGVCTCPVMFGTPQMTYDADELLEAYDLARSARF